MTSKIKDSWESAIIRRLRETMTHPLLDEMGSLVDLRIYLSHWIFAAWDYMSLLAALRNFLHNPDLPWLPPAKMESAYLVAERLHRAEAIFKDGHLLGSLYDLAHRALDECGGSSAQMDRFLAEVSITGDIAFSLEEIGVPESINEYILTTWDIIAGEDLPALAGAFCCGREMVNAELSRSLRAGSLSGIIGKSPSFEVCLEFAGTAAPEEILDTWRPLIDYAIKDSSERRDRFTEAAETAIGIHEVLWMGIRREIAESRSSFEI